MSLVTGGLGGTNSSALFNFNIDIKKLSFENKKLYKSFQKKIIKINFKIKEVQNEN